MFSQSSLMSLALASLATAQNAQLPAVLTADIIAGLGNNTLFNRWRSTYHFISPAGWMNVCSSLYTLIGRLTSAHRIRVACCMIQPQTPTTCTTNGILIMSIGEIFLGGKSLNLPLEIHLLIAVGMRLPRT